MGFSFTSIERDAIKKAVMEAESATSGEIVPYFVESSDDYEESNWRAASFGALLALAIAASLSFTWNFPFVITPWEVASFAIVMGGLCYALTRYVPYFKRLITPKSLMSEKVIQRALIAFLNEEVFNTENRTGILIFVSHFEHMVDVIGDSGINAKVKKEGWDHVVQEIVKGIKAGNAAEGIVNGIDLCGKLLVESGVHKPKDNPNELSDDIRLG